MPADHETPSQRSVEPHGCATRRPPLEGIVAEDPLRPLTVNFLTYNRVYSKIEGSSSIKAKPCVLHFGGFQVGHVHQLNLVLTNTSSQGTRVHLIPPTTPYFAVAAGQRRGNIAPGLSESYMVEFCPGDWRYYYDCIRIHMQDENLLVPIHAYPTTNAMKFPKRIDFGKCEIGESSVKTVPLECKVPIDFEFCIKIIKPNTSFQIHPLEGVIPSNGKINVDICFVPATLTTQELVVEVRVAEFGCEPVTCSIVGSGFPGLARSRVLQSSTGVSSTAMADLDGTALLSNAARARVRRSLQQSLGRSGGNGLSSRATSAPPGPDRGDGDRTAGTRQLSAGAGGPGPPPSAALTAAGTTGFARQEEGRPKTSREAASRRRAREERQRAELEALLDTAQQTGLHPLDDLALPRSTKEALFLLLCERQQAVRGGSGYIAQGRSALGEQPPTPQEVAAALSASAASQRAQRRADEAASMHRLSVEGEEEGAPHTAGAVSAGDYESLAGWQPQFVVMESNDWRKRQAVLRRFVNAARVVLLRLRAQKRLDHLHGILASLGGANDRSAAEVASTLMLSQPAAQRPGVAPSRLMTPDKVAPRTAPEWQPPHGYAAAMAAAAAVDAPYQDFSLLEPMELKVPSERWLMGYEEEDLCRPVPYVPLPEGVALLSGAPEEHRRPQPTGTLPPELLPGSAGAPGLPDCLRQSPFVVAEMGDTYSGEQVHVSVAPVWGRDAPRFIQPVLLRFPDSTREEVEGSCSTRAMEGLPLISQRWLPRREMNTWEDPEPPPPELSGPRPEDLSPDRPEDADKPPAPVRVPTDESLAQFIPPSVDKAAASTSVDRTAGMTPQQQPSQGQERLLLPRHMKQQELECDKHAAHLEAVSGFVKATEQYNALLKAPATFSIQL